MAVINCKGDLLKALDDGKITYAVHQVNCHGRMGSGIAKSIRAKYPVVYDNYMAKVQPAKDEGLHMELLGDIQICAVYKNFYKTLQHPCVVNFFSQFNYGYDGCRYTSYDAFWECLNRLKNGLQKGSRIGFPKNIGCGLGGANWNVIEKMIEEVLGKDFTVYIYELEEEKK
mgnify:FL=1